jgi:hypothetical protein
MGATNTMGMVEALRPDLIKRAVKMRKRQESHETIAHMLSEQLLVPVGRESVRKWFKAKGDALVGTTDDE